MAPYVKVLEAGGYDAPPEPWPREEMLSLLGQGYPRAWQLVCTSVVELAQSGQNSALEIFVCLRDEELLVPPERAGLERLLRQARDCSWGGKLFGVASTNLQWREAPWETQESRELWLRTALEGRVLDLLQIPYPSSDPSSIQRDDLRGAADRAFARHRALSGLRRFPGPWGCIVADPEKRLLQRFLSTWIEYAALKTAPNQVIVLDEPLDQVGKLRKLLGLTRGRRCLVATLKNPSEELRAFCGKKGLEGPIQFQGELELWYFLLRLNEHRAGAPSAASTGPPEELPEQVREVELGGSPVFRAVEVDEPTVVITSAFDPSEPAQCLEAARDVARVSERYPVGFALCVEPAVTLGRLFQLIDRWKSLHVWVHLGHGSSVKGLWEVDGRLAAPEMWLQCFRERSCEMSLALFLTCQSAPIARLFAEAGVLVSIGFEARVESDMCRELAVDVLEAVAHCGTRQADVLLGFRRGFFRITAQERLDSCPVAYYLKRV